MSKPSMINKDNSAMNIARHECAHALYAKQLGATGLRIYSTQKPWDGMMGNAVKGQMASSFKCNPMKFKNTEVVVLSYVGALAEKPVPIGILEGERVSLLGDGFPVELVYDAALMRQAQQWIRKHREDVETLAEMVVSAGGDVEAEQFGGMLKKLGY